MHGRRAALRWIGAAAVIGLLLTYCTDRPASKLALEWESSDVVARTDEQRTSALLLLGFGVAADRSPLEAGQSRARDFDSWLASNGPRSRLPYKSSQTHRDAYPRPDWSIPPSEWCVPGPTSDCLAWLKLNRQSVEQFAVEYAPLLNRYKELLLPLRDFGQILPPRRHAPNEDFDAVMDTAALHLALTSLKLLDGDTARALVDLHRVVQFQRAFLRRSASHWHRVFAIEMYRASLFTVAEWVRHQPGTAVELAAIVKPLESAEIDVSRLVQDAYRHTGSLVESLCNGVQWHLGCEQVVGLFVHEQALRNWFAQEFAAQARESLSARQALAAQKSPQHSLARDHAVATGYNAGGIWLAHSIKLPDYIQYAVRGYDLDCLSRLVLARLGIAAFQRDSAAVRAFLWSSAPRDPYTDEPLALDGSAMSISCTAHGFHASEGRISIRL